MAPDDTDDDLPLVERVASEIVACRGIGAVAYLIEQADIAERIGDATSARAWRDIPACAKDLV